MSASEQEIQVNGEMRSVPRPLTVAQLLELLQIQAPHVGVERNRKLVPKAEHDRTPVEAGDELEIVTFVGGG